MYRGLTWDHPRGRHALERAAARTAGADGNRLIGWDVQPLEGFESAPIDELARQYDVIVLDHPHLGDALQHGALQPWDDLVGRAWIDRLEAACVGPSVVSYRMADRLWALPLDAATQVAVRLPELVDRSPVSWADVEALDVPVALCLAGPHALMNFSSLCVGLGEEPRLQPGQGFVGLSAGVDAYQRLARIVARMPAELAELNPIGLLDRMLIRRDIGYVPLIYGYVNYAMGDPDHEPLIFDDVARLLPDGRRGSVIGGTSLALSARCTPDQRLVDHLTWLLSPDAQQGFIPDNDGQPSLRSAWTDDRVNAAAGDFYRNTLATIKDSWVRPRVPGYIGFQSVASALLREALLSGEPASGTVQRLNQLYDALTAPPALSPQSPAPSPQIPEPSPQIPAPSPQIPEPSPQIPAPSPQIPAPSPQIPAPSPQIPAPSPQIPAPSPQIPAPSPQIPAPSPQIPELVEGPYRIKED